MNQQPKTLWGYISMFLKTLLGMGTDAVNVLEKAVDMADDQVSCMAEKMEEDLAVELDSYHDRIVGQNVLANAQSAKALVEFAAKNPEMSQFIKDETAKLDSAVARFRARKMARKAGAVPF